MKLGAYAGMATPVVWFVLLFVGGLARPGYDHIRQFMTELQTGASAPIVLADSLAVAALLLVFALALRSAFGGDRVALAITALVALKAVATAGTGLVQGDVDPLVRTPSGQLHNTIVGVGNIALALACLAVAWRSSSLAAWRDLRGYSAATAVLTLGLLVVLATMTTGGTARADVPLPDHGGLVQRLSMLVTDLWPAVIGARLLRLAGSRSSSALLSRT